MDFFPVLHTSRLTLRKLTVDDIPFLIRYASNTKISSRVLNIPHPYEEHDAVFRIRYVVEGFRNKTWYTFAIIHRDRDELIGEIGLHPDKERYAAQLGYWVGEPFWGQGIATEAIGAALDFGFEQVMLKTIFADCQVDNVASIRALMKNGMRQKFSTGTIAQYAITATNHRDGVREQ